MATKKKYKDYNMRDLQKLLDKQGLEYIFMHWSTIYAGPDARFYVKTTNDNIAICIEFRNDVMIKSAYVSITSWETVLTFGGPDSDEDRLMSHYKEVVYHSGDGATIDLEIKV